MDVFPKFIIETDPTDGDVLIIAKCTYHKQLASDVKRVKGGGGWSLDRDKKVFTLWGSSYDFGRAELDDIKDCINRGKVFSSPSLVRNFINDGLTFQYMDESGEITILSN